MPAPDTEERSTVLADLNKQVMTLASGILALAATFATGIVGKSPDWLQLGSIGLAAVLLLASVCFALVGNARILNYIKEKNETTPDPTKVSKAWNGAAVMANIGFFSFAFSLLFLLGFAALRLSNAPSDAEAAVRASTDFLIGQGKIKSRDEWLSFRTISGPGGDELEVKFKSTAGTDHVCTVASGSGTLLTCS